MGHFGYGWQQGMDNAAAASLADAQPLPFAQDASMSVVAEAEAESARRRRQQQEEEEKAAIRLVHLLVTCAHAIQAGDYAAATANLDEARSALATTVSTAAGIGRVTSHFAAALAQRLFPPSNHSASSSAAHVDAASSAELYLQFYEAGPYLKFAHFTANQAILEALEGCDRVHVVDLGIMQGQQWPAFIQTLSLRPGGPPSLRITGVGGARDGLKLKETGAQLAEFARAVNVPCFSFRGVVCDSLDELQPWMFQVAHGEALAVNSVCQLHRLLVDPDAASTSLPSPVDAVLAWVAAMRPRVVTVVEQEADHNKPALVERFTNALYYYGTLFDSMMSAAGGLLGAGAAAEAYLRREIFNIVCGEGSGRVERHEPLGLWHARLCRAGLLQTRLGPGAVGKAEALLRAFSGGAAGYRVQERDGCLTLAWNDRPLFTASAWHAPPRTNPDADTGSITILDEHVDILKSFINKDERCVDSMQQSSIKDERVVDSMQSSIESSGRQQAVAALVGIVME